MPSWRLVCPKCGWEGASEEYYHKCPRCGSPLRVAGSIPRPPRPILGEGSTPYVTIGGVGYKLEYLNPTGSFKDRGSSLSVWLADRLGYKCVVEDSSGNTGVSVAAYAARLGLKARIHVPASASSGKIGLLHLLGAEVVLHGSRLEAAHAAESEAGDCFYVAHSYSPIFVEGISSLAGELLEAGARGPVIVPASSGTLLLGLAWGFERAGAGIDLIAVQSPEAASLRGRTPLLASVGGGSGRLLDALVLANPPRLDEMAAKARGLVIIGDEAALEALRKLARMGFIVEPSSATVYAALEALGLREATLVLTGSGLKYAEALAKWLRGQG